MKKILILKLGAIGDVIHSLPVLVTLRSRFPQAHISWAVEERSAPVLEDNPHLTELILLERKRLKGLKGIGYFRQWIGNLKIQSFDVVLDLHNLLKTGLIAIGTGAPQRIGFRKVREGNFLFMNRSYHPRRIPRQFPRQCPNHVILRGMEVKNVRLRLIQNLHHLIYIPGILYRVLSVKPEILSRNHCPGRGLFGKTSRRTGSTEEPNLMTPLNQITA